MLTSWALSQICSELILPSLLPAFSFPIFSFFSILHCSNPMMARYEMLPVRIPKLQRDLSSAETKPLLCSSWRVSLAASAQLGNFSVSLPSSLLLHHLDVAGMVFVFSPRLQVRYDCMIAVGVMFCRDISFYMNGCKPVSTFFFFFFGEEISPCKVYILTLCFACSTISNTLVDEILTKWSSWIQSQKTVKKKSNRINIKNFLIQLE